MIGKPQEIIGWLFRQDRDKLFEVKERKRKRSLTQNAYYWVLLNQLARALDYPDSEVHGYMLREYGVCQVFSVREDVPIEGYFRYYDVIGRGMANGQWFKHIKAYKGSSEMNSTEFTHLLNGLREECVAQGIQVMTPAEIAQLTYVEGVA